MITYMKYFITLFSVLVFNSLLAQDNYNLKQGFIAEGYDVVAYFSNEATKGEDNFVSEHNHVNYKFSTAKNLKIFNSNPEKYVPQYGGYCAYAVAVKGEKIGVNPKTFQIIDDKLYLFYNKWGVNTLENWNDEGVEKLQVQANENWKKIVKKEFSF
ncbi:MAG: YHS domain-containing protein [bacterium]|jgi:YHS domain-containing protein